MLTSESKYVYTSDTGLVIGFHGCEESVRDAIVSGSTTLKASKINMTGWVMVSIFGKIIMTVLWILLRIPQAKRVYRNLLYWGP